MKRRWGSRSGGEDAWKGRIMQMKGGKGGRKKKERKESKRKKRKNKIKKESERKMIRTGRNKGKKKN